MAMAFRTLISRHPSLFLFSARTFATRPLPLVRLRPLLALADWTAAKRPGGGGGGLRCFSTSRTASSLNDPSPNWSNRPPKETILLDGCDFEHWLVVVEPPDPQLTRDEIIKSYIQTLAKIVGSEEEARMKIYSVSTKHYFAFGALVSEELSYKLKEIPGVRWVLPDSYLDVKNKDYGGEPFINGEAVPYDPKYHEEWVRNNARANERNRRNDRPRNSDRSRNFERRRENMQNFQNRPPPPPPTYNQETNPGQNLNPTRDMPPNNTAPQAPPSSFQGGPGGYQAPPSSFQGGPGGYPTPPPNANQAGPGGYQTPPPNANQAGPGGYQTPPPNANQPGPGSYQGSQNSYPGGAGGFQGNPNVPRAGPVGYQGPPQGGYQGAPQGGGYQGGPPGGYRAPPQSGYQGPPQGGYQGPPQGGYQGPPQGGGYQGGYQAPPSPPQGGFQGGPGGYQGAPNTTPLGGPSGFQGRPNGYQGSTNQAGGPPSNAYQGGGDGAYQARDMPGRD